MSFWGRSCFVFAGVILMLLMGIYQTSIFGGVTPGTYKVTFDELENVSDTWIFHEDGTFKSEGLGLESTWKNTGGDAFEIKADKYAIKNAIKMYAKMVGLKTSDVLISIKNIEIHGVAKGGTINGDIKTVYDMRIKRPIQVSLDTRGTEKFQGEQMH